VIPAIATIQDSTHVNEPFVTVTDGTSGSLQRPAITLKYEMNYGDFVTFGFNDDRSGRANTTRGVRVGEAGKLRSDRNATMRYIREILFTIH